MSAPSSPVSLLEDDRKRFPVDEVEPGSFALVMATGIVSIAGLLEGWTAIAWLLFALNLVVYALLWALILVRLVRWPRRLLGDLVDDRRAPGFFTLVAGTAVLATQCLLLADQRALAQALGAFGAGLWLLVTYTFFTAAIARGTKLGIGGVSGGWLLAAVSTESLAVVGTLLGPGLPQAAPVLLAALALWLLGGMEYLLIIGPIFQRLLFLDLTPETLTPLYWINSGALSITTLAGASLVSSSASSGVLTELLPFIEGFSLFFWAAASWWIPLLVLMGVWRHLLRRQPLAYTTEYWGLVFPLGMYSVATEQLGRAMGLSVLAGLAHAMAYVALAAWSVTALGLCRRLVRRATEL